MTEDKKKRIRELRKWLAGLNAIERAELTAKHGVVTIEGRALSIVNVCLLIFQYPSVTIVGGYRQWRIAGRQVRKGEHGHIIWFPMGSKNEDGQVQDTDDLRFALATVFDISQTDPVEVEAIAV